MWSHPTCLRAVPKTLGAQRSETIEFDRTIRRKAMLTLVRRLPGGFGRTRPLEMVLQDEVLSETDKTKEDDKIFVEAHRPVEQRRMPPCTRSTRLENSDELSPEEAEIVEYSLTEEESDDALEIPPAQAGSSSREGPPIRTDLRSKAVTTPAASSSKGASSSKATIATAGLSSKAKVPVKSKSTRPASHNTRLGSSASSSDPKRSRTLETPRGVAKGRIAKAIRTGKEAVLRQVVKAAQAVMGPCALGEADTLPVPRTSPRTADCSRVGVKGTKSLAHPVRGRRERDTPT